MSKAYNRINSILTHLDPAPFTTVRKDGKSRYIIVCDHATNVLPKQICKLELDESSMESHIAIDIGALDVAIKISEILDAPLIYTGYSRLVIDVNRPLEAESSIPRISDGVIIPFNNKLDPNAKKQRVEEIFEPYHEAVSSIITKHINTGTEPILIAIHSFTPTMGGLKKPWEIGITYAKSADFSGKVLKILEEKTTYNIGNNKPYAVDKFSDYTIPVHGDNRNIQNVLLEIRQDLLKNKQHIMEWGTLLAEILLKIEKEEIKQESVHDISL